MDIVHNFIPITWKNKMIEKGFNYAWFTSNETTDIFESSVVSLELKENKWKAQKNQDQSSNKKKNQGEKKT